MESPESGVDSGESWDLIVVGAGTAGIPAAIAAAESGGRVLLLDMAKEWGGSLWVSTGWLSAAGTKIQDEYGVHDSVDAHFEDVLRISKGTIDAELVRLALEQAPDAVDWLMDNGFDLTPGHPIKGDKHDPYLIDRYYRGLRDGLSILEVFKPKLQGAIDKNLVSVLMETEVLGLATHSEDDSTTRVVGVHARSVGESGSASTTYRANNVILATGGYNSNPELFFELNNHTMYGLVANTFSRGAGIRLAESVGGWTRGADNFWGSFGSVLQDHQYPSPVRCTPIHRPEIRLPWEIYVNLEGKRFIAEDCPGVGLREAALLEQTEMRRFIVFDARILFESPPLIPGWTPGDILNNAGMHPMFFVGETVVELATSAGIPPGALVQTIDEYNSTLTGTDPFGRNFRPRAIERGPFFAIDVHTVSNTSAVGVAVDQELRVVNRNNDPVAGLYACGELLGAGQLGGAASVGGMLVTPAIGLGLALGRKLGASGGNDV